MLLIARIKAICYAVLFVAFLLCIGCTPVLMQKISASNFDSQSKWAILKGYVAAYPFLACSYAKVVLVQSGKEAKQFVTQTNEEGYFEFSKLPPGVYTVQTEGYDFPNPSRNRIEVYAGQTTVISIIGHMKHDIHTG